MEFRPGMHRVYTNGGNFALKQKCEGKGEQTGAMHCPCGAGDYWELRLRNKAVSGVTLFGLVLTPVFYVITSGNRTRALSSAPLEA